MKHCCLKMEGVLEENNSPLWYKSYVREYYLPYPPLRKQLPANAVFTVETLYYCPWCGSKLPPGLTDEWHEIVKSKFNITNTLDKKQLEKIPQEYMTAEWWEKKGL